MSWKKLENQLNDDAKKRRDRITTLKRHDQIFKQAACKHTWKPTQNGYKKCVKCGLITNK